MKPLQHPASNWSAWWWLRERGCPQSLFAVARALGGWIIFCIAIGSVRYLKTTPGTKLGDLSPVLIAGTLAFGVVQWRLAVDQKALDAYQAEINSAAASPTAKDPAVRAMMLPQFPAAAADDPAVVTKARYVYEQLDLLEFAVERFRAGVALPFTTARAVLTFARKCDVPEFRALVEELLRGEYASYSPVTEAVALSCCATCRTAVSSSGSSSSP